MDWTNRKEVGAGKPRKATMAAGCLLFIQLLMQVLNFFRADLAPLKQKLDDLGQQMTRIEQRLEDHERRIKRLEDGTGEMGTEERPAVRRKDSKR
jgi:hypothetical protein